MTLNLEPIKAPVEADSIFIFHDEDTHEFEIFYDVKRLENHLSDSMNYEHVDEELNIKVYRVDAVSKCVEVDRRTADYCPMCNNGNTLEEVLEGTELDECPHCEGAGRVYSDEPDKPWTHLEDVEIRWEMEPHVAQMGPKDVPALIAEVERLRELLKEASPLVAEREYLETMEFSYSQDYVEPSPAEWGIHCGYQQTASYEPFEQFSMDVKRYHDEAFVENEENEMEHNLTGRIRQALGENNES